MRPSHRLISESLAGSEASNEPSGAKAERTRASILAAAEKLFSRRGYEATRLEDVADAVQVTRAALFYYYKDKQTLYGAMLVDAFGPLEQQLTDVLAADKSVGERIEIAVAAWIDAIVARPTLARLILRFVADGAEQPAHSLFSANGQLAMKFFQMFQQGRKKGEIKPLHDDPFHVASAVVGTTVFYVSALGALLPHDRFEPLDPKQVAAHKSEVLLVVRRLLGITGKRER